MQIIFITVLCFAKISYGKLVKLIFEGVRVSVSSWQNNNKKIFPILILLAVILSLDHVVEKSAQFEDEGYGQNLPQENFQPIWDWGGAWSRPRLLIGRLQPMSKQ